MSVSPYKEINTYPVKLISPDASIYDPQFSEMAFFCKTWGYLKYHSSFQNSFEYFDKYVIENINSPADFTTSLTDNLIDEAFLRQMEERQPKQYADTAHHKIVYDPSWMKNSRFGNDFENRLKQYTSYKTKAQKGVDKYVSDLPQDVFFTNTSLDSYNEKCLLIFKLWNIVEYFYPHKWNMDADWSQSLEEAITALNNHVDIDFIIQRMVAQMNDSHVVLLDLDYQKWYYGDGIFKKFPFYLELIGNQIYFSNQLEIDSLGKYQGKKVTYYNNMKATDIIDSLATMVSASNENGLCYLIESSLNQAINHPALGDSIIKLKFENGTEAHFARVSASFQTVSPTKSSYLPEDTLFSREIGYLNITKRIKLQKKIRKYKDTKAIILDLRGYPQINGFEIPKLFSKDPKTVAQFYHNSSNNPGNYIQGSEVTYFETGFFRAFVNLIFRGINTGLFPMRIFDYEGEIIVLIDENAISYSETIGMILQAYVPNLTFVGRNTAGANGNVLEVDLPGNYKFQFTNLDFRYPDNSHIQGEGIVPDVFIKKEVGYSKKETDPILEAALGIAMEN
ncbi:hypothetical protein GCM10011506_37160 [Marivirga lumbricoides]|uniref:Tail specific protease domain-containing protein n=2 Tax=Marivirga lumbricoides TaxID=1046115 RepID=A0ABQ1N388_9BACT|nr:hypothetical protein GCM10011506_37160 [Marivirga lumbricoides]